MPSLLIFTAKIIFHLKEVSLITFMVLLQNALLYSSNFFCGILLIFHLNFSYQMSHDERDIKHVKIWNCKEISRYESLFLVLC
jgi:hypothetical protein